MDSLLDADANDGYQFSSARRRTTAASLDFVETPGSARRRTTAASFDFVGTPGSSRRRAAAASADYSDFGGSVTASSSAGRDRSVELADDEARMLTALAGTLLEKLTQAYEELAGAPRPPAADKTRWKSLKKREQLTVYKEKKRSSSDGSAPALPQLVLTGSVPGRLQDALYGLSSATSLAMKFRSAYAQDASVVDAEVLATIEGPSPAEPFRFLGLKWILQHHASATASFAKKRDVVFLEATGTTALASGEVVGYHLVHSVELHARARMLRSASAPVVRAKTSLGYLFRERAGDRAVDVFARGYYDPQGGMLQFVALALAAEQMLATATRCFECAQLKKLSHAAHESSRQRRRAATTALASARGTTNGSALLADMAAAAQEVDREQAAPACAVCARRLGKMLQRGGAACAICALLVCARCSVTKKLSFTREDAAESAALQQQEQQLLLHHQDDLLERSGVSLGSGRGSTRPSRSASVKSALSSALSVHSHAPSRSRVQREICQKPMAFCTRCLLTTSALSAAHVAAEELRLEQQALAYAHCASSTGRCGGEGGSAAPTPRQVLEFQQHQQSRRTTQYSVHSAGVWGSVRAKTPRAKAFSSASTASSTTSSVVLYEEPTAATA
ncbi:hypothetical protein PybrP1_006594 [[Pythium] brassicae (nom. inval.)]|nr:hypothetical protein PybrP1_006594 [[Pythium] brassicae (nom. inval.)]